MIRRAQYWRTVTMRYTFGLSEATFSNLKPINYFVIMSYMRWRFMTTQGQGHIQHFKISFPQKKKTLGRLKPNFIWSLHGMLGWKFVQTFRVTWPRWLPGPFMETNLQKSQSSLSAWWNTGPPATHWAHSEDWSDWVDVQAVLRIRWAHILFCWFCSAAARIS